MSLSSEEERPEPGRLFKNTHCFSDNYHSSFLDGPLRNHINNQTLLYGIYPATFSEGLKQNIFDSSSSRQPAYLLASSVFLCCRSFSGCLSTKEVLLHESFHLRPRFLIWFFWLHCVETSPTVIPHIYSEMLQRAAAHVSLSVSPHPCLPLEHPGNRGEL